MPERLSSQTTSAPQGIPFRESRVKVPGTPIPDTMRHGRTKTVAPGPEDETRKAGIRNKYDQESQPQAAHTV